MFPMPPPLLTQTRILGCFSVVAVSAAVAAAAVAIAVAVAVTVAAAVAAAAAAASTALDLVGGFNVLLRTLLFRYSFVKKAP